MRPFHLALSTPDVAASVADYTQRLGTGPCVVVPGEYALWRTPQLNLSIRQDPSCAPGSLRHLGWEDPDAESFSTSTDVNGIVWERFAAEHQAEEIGRIWPDTPDQAS